MSDPTLSRLAAALADRYRLEQELGAGGKVDGPGVSSIDLVLSP